VFYDPRYHVVGALLQIQAVGTIFAFASSSYANVLWAMRLGRLSVGLVATQAACLFALLILGHHLGGLLGLMTASSFIGLCIYPVNAWIFRRLGLWHPRMDAAVFVVGALAAAWVWEFGAWRAVSP
jgi:O-antigen/teichoic acid export membrane protein